MGVYSVAAVSGVAGSSVVELQADEIKTTMKANRINFI
jgi:hypothetical protein